MLEITPIPAFYDNYIWMVSHPESQQVLVVDPGMADGVIDTIKKKGYTLKGILLTHHHADHTGGVQKIINQFPAPVYGPTNDSIPTCTHPLKEGDTIRFPDMSLTLSILDIPGHTKGHIAFLGDDFVFCGDTLFAGGCGRIFEGTPAQMAQSLQKLAALPPATKVYCAHEYTAANLKFAKMVEPNNLDIKERIKQTEALRAKGLPTIPSTIATELNTNPFLRCNAPEVIKSAEKHIGHTLENEYISVFSAIRHWKDNF